MSEELQDLTSSRLERSLRIMPGPHTLYRHKGAHLQGERLISPTTAKVSMPYSRVGADIQGTSQPVGLLTTQLNVTLSHKQKISITRRLVNSLTDNLVLVLQGCVVVRFEKLQQ